MNFCPVEYDTEKYLAAQCLLDDENEADRDNAEAQVNDPKSTYFWADSSNMSEALSEADTPVHSIKDGMLYADQLRTLLESSQYEAYGKLCEAISKEYWESWVFDLTN